MKRALTLLLSLTIVVAAIGCGGDEDSDGAEPTPRIALPQWHPPATPRIPLPQWHGATPTPTETPDSATVAAQCSACHIGTP